MRDKGLLTLQRIRDSKIGLPTGKTEAWRHSNLRTMFPCTKYLSKSNSELNRELVAKRISEFVDERCEGSCIVYVDGRFDSDLSRLGNFPTNVNIDTFSVGTLSGKGGVAEELLVRECMAAVPDAEEIGRDSFSSDSLTAVNMANCIDACLISVGEGIKVETPLQIINYCSDGITNNNDDVDMIPASFPKLVIALNENSHLTLKQSFIGRSTMVTDGVKASDLNQAAIIMSSTNIHVSKGATLDHSYEQDVPAEHRHFEVINADIYSESAYNTAILQTGGKTGRINAHVTLHEQHSNCSISSVNLSHLRQSHDLHSSIIHSAPECQSRQQHRNVLGTKGETIFKGRIRIPKIAQKTDSDQMCRTLMLGEKCRLVAMPTLEITADDVVCSHGAAVADLDENSMFYLSARGIDRREARKLLLRGFSLEALDGSLIDTKATQRVITKTDSMTPDNDERVQGGNQKMVSM